MHIGIIKDHQERLRIGRNSAEFLARPGERASVSEPWARPHDRPQDLNQAMNKWSDDDWYQEVRFSKEQFEYLCQELHVPLVFPTEKQRQESSTFRKVRMLDGRLVFAITLSRLAQPTTVKGQMTRKWGYHRTEITKWTNACMECLMDT